MANIIEYVATYWPPIFILGGGVSLVGVFLYLHLLKKRPIIKLIAHYIFRDQFAAEKSAESLFNVLTSFVITVGLLWIILASFYLFP